MRLDNDVTENAASSTSRSSGPKKRKLTRPVRKLTYDYNDNYESSDDDDEYEYKAHDRTAKDESGVNGKRDLQAGSPSGQATWEVSSTRYNLSIYLKWCRPMLWI